MSSKLFHTVVAFGITLGAAACSAEAQDPAPQSSEAAVISTDTDTSKTDTAKTEPAPAAEQDRFCEVAWPTTKGGPRPDFTCVDPTNACGEYPGSQFDGLIFSGADRCHEVNADGTCGKGSHWLFCKDTGTSHEFTCPSGTKRSTECTWPSATDTIDTDDVATK